MNSNAKPSVPSAVANAATRRAQARPTLFLTREAKLLCRTRGLKPYFRQKDIFCRLFLERVSNPRAFQGLRLFFPFVRLGSLLQLLRRPDSWSNWLGWALAAGHDLGRAHPDLVDDVLPGYEMDATLRLLGRIQAASNEAQATLAGWRVAIGKCWIQSCYVPGNCWTFALVCHLVECFRIGYAMGTVARNDPQFADYLADLPEHLEWQHRYGTARLLLGAPLREFDSPVIDRMEHPLLQMARTFHPKRPSERDTILEFLRQQLRTRNVRSEGEWPKGLAASPEWIGLAVEFGKRLNEEQPQLVARIISERSEDDLVRVGGVIAQVIDEAGSVDPEKLLLPMTRWQQRAYGWHEPAHLGDELDQAVCFAELAIWIPWVLGNTCATRRRRPPAPNAATPGTAP